MKSHLTNWLCCLLLFVASASSFAQSPEGNWIATYDQNVAGKMLKDKDFAVMELRVTPDGVARFIIKTLLNGFSTVCNNCPPGYAMKPTIGLEWCKNLQPVSGKPGEFESGWALDPETGDTLTEVRIKKTGRGALELSGRSAKSGSIRTFQLRRQQ